MRSGLFYSWLGVDNVECMQYLCKGLLRNDSHSQHERMYSMCSGLLLTGLGLCFVECM